ncbi:transposase [Nodularia harveyana UHCC-0300]|uniref:Transposase n=1 Tax=Nodularia harveyana UHCC-0300 TaxID=2974287 RepID=A0ABU5UGL9_9CYAN|nr:transposase [Nodularia harveyana]MEA5582478.1 transposase [Nodularia harveyana UHCC-0300]
MPYSSSLTDQEWEIIEPLLPDKKQTRPLKWTRRQILDGIFYQLKKGCNWFDLPRELPPYSTVFWHYKQWRKVRSDSNCHPNPREPKKQLLVKPGLCRSPLVG